MTHKLPGTALVPVFAHRGGGVPETGAFGYGRICAALAFEACFDIIPEGQGWSFRGPTEAPSLTRHAEARLRERAPWLSSLPHEGWRLWAGPLGYDPTSPSGARVSRWLATLEIVGTDGAPVLIVCPLADGAATTLYIAPPYEGHRRAWGPRHIGMWWAWKIGEDVRYGDYLAPPTEEQAALIEPLLFPREPATPSPGFTEEERLLGM